jgi:glutathione synthase/RimK-type ligase-like ATP-grasp enzyme
MKIGIHHNPGSFSDRWIKYCELNKIDFKIVDCYQNDIIQQLEDCDAFMWHHNHLNYKDLIFAKQLLYSLENAGKKVFPDFKTNWHFDDKIAQKYLFEAFNIPHVPTYIFYTKQDALKWVEKANFPQIFKLRCGAGSLNVSIIHSKKVAINKIKIAFGKGFFLFNRSGYLKELIRRYGAGKDILLNVLKALIRLVILSDNTKMLKKEKGYVYFQEFIFSQGFDIRVVVIGDKAFAIKRKVRKNDFRASGSGDIIYNMDEIPISAIKIAFETTNKIQANCLTYDIVFNEKEEPLILEVSFGFVMFVYDECPGYWDKNLQLHLGQFNPQSWMVELLK